MSLTVTPLYAGLLTLLYLVLTVRVVRYRRGNQISLGDQGDSQMAKRVRVHGNWAEYAPLVMILLLITELQGAPALVLHLIGAAFLIGRICHAVGVSQTPQIMPLRVVGMVLTISVMILTSLGLIGHSLL
ncbi:MAPEG family protein [Sulfitobacter sp. HNIBRBA2951]|uniref:MAPEG family protein n=1 Tax=Sulfitobacter aquimarinus TaxID=3158557 RepID=UPI0032DE5340